MLFEVGRDEVMAKARALAQKHGHARVATAHVGLVLLQANDVQVWLAHEGLSRMKVEHHLRSLLDNEPSATAYRDKPPGAVDAAVEALFAPAPALWGLATRDATLVHTLERVLAPLQQTTALRFDDAALVQLMNATSGVVARMKHRRILVEHVLVALAEGTADDGRFARALDALENRADDVARRLRSRLRDPRLRSQLVARFKDLRLRANLLANVDGDDDDAGCELIVLEILRSPAAILALTAVDVSPPALVSAYVRGAFDSELDPAINAAAEVIFHNDDVTTQEVVVRILRQHFGKSKRDAKAIMLEVHHSGSFAFPVADAELAEAALRAAQAECAALGAPLRMELRRGSEGERTPDDE